jgi:hypothetical protein
MIPKCTTITPTSVYLIPQSLERPRLSMTDFFTSLKQFLFNEVTMNVTGECAEWWCDKTETLLVNTVVL